PPKASPPARWFRLPPAGYLPPSGYIAPWLWASYALKFGLRAAMMHPTPPAGWPSNAADREFLHRKVVPQREPVAIAGASDRRTRKRDRPGLHWRAGSNAEDAAPTR